MTATQRDLIYDIGLNNGDDAAYYMHLGYRVIGVEADPRLADECQSRFARDIEQGRMTVVNVGILRENGSFTFYRHKIDTGWSSFNPEKTGKSDDWEQITVPCTTTRALFDKYGLPYYMKVDIEGADLQAIQSLTTESAPPYVSLELSAEDDTIGELVKLGYDSFKLINGATFYSTAPILDHEIAWRALRKASKFPPVRLLLSHLPESHRKTEFDPTPRYSPDGYNFTRYNSGPFGELAAGDWIKQGQAVERLDRLKADLRRAGQPLWWDLHARHSSVVSAQRKQAPVMG